MRIAILGDALDLQYAGVHVYLRGLLNALAEADRENEYLLVRPRPGGDFENMRELIVPIRPGIPGHQYLRALTAMPRRLAGEGVDVVVEPAHFGPFRLPERVKRVTVIHDLTPVLFPQFHPIQSSVVHKIVLPGILKRADGIVANSRHTQSDIEKFYPVSKGKISVVLPGREAIFRPVQEAVVLKKYGIRQPYLLCVGTLEPRKNLTALLEAYEQFRRATGQAVQLVLAGKDGWKNGPFFEALRRSPFRSDIVLTGYTERSELPVLCSMARLFVYPSLYEGFGLPALEAMACGAPVLLSNASSLPEVGGDAAGYFDPGDVDGLSKKLAELLGDERKLQKMSELSLAQAEKFNWRRSAEAFVSLMKKLKRGS